MATTRKTTGHSAPRKAYVPEAITTKTTKTKTKTKTKKPASGPGVGKPKANTSKPRAEASSTTTGAGVTKKKATPATKRKTTVGDKVKGVLEKAVGEIENKPGKKGAGTKKIRGTDGKGVSKKT